MLRRQAEVLPPLGERFFQAARQAVLVAPRHQRKARGRTDGRVGIRLREAHALCSQAIQVRGGVLGLAVDAEVGPAEVISDDEKDVGSGGCGLTHDCPQTRDVWHCGGQERLSLRGGPGVWSQDILRGPYTKGMLFAARLTRYPGDAPGFATESRLFPPGRGSGGFAPRPRATAPR